jgi:hypothetical protein
MLADVREGLAYCRSQPWLWASIAGAGLANFAIFSPLGVLIPLLVRRVLHSGAPPRVLLIPGVRDPDHESSRPNAAGDEA